MNILFIHEVDWMRKVVYDVHMLSEAMSLRGHNVYAIDYESMWQRNGSSPHNIKVSRVFPDACVNLIRPAFIKLPVISRMSAFISHYFAIDKVIKERKIDVILLYSVPTNGLQAVYWAKKYKIPVVFRSLDILNQLVSNTALGIVTKWLEQVIYPEVDMCLTITPKLSDYMHKMQANKTKVLNMPVDINRFYPYPSKPVFGDTKVLLFMGTLFDFSGLYEFLWLYPEILKQLPDTKLLIVGDGEQRYKLQAVINTLALHDSVIFTGIQPYEDMPYYINCADVCLLPFHSNEITKDIFPGKVVQYLACGKPLVSMNLQGVNAVIQGKEQGVVFVENHKEMVDAALALLTHPKEAEKLGSNGLKYTRENHSCEKVAEKLEHILVELKNGY